MPIKNWYEDRSDRELYNMTPILEFLAKVPDVRDFIKRMTDKNDLSYSKALQVMNSYNNGNIPTPNNPSASPDNYKNLTLINPLSPSLNQAKNKNIKDYIYKPSSPNPIPNNEEQKYSSNIMRERQSSKGIISNFNNAKKDTNDKQNINIVLINNHINRYVINPQENTMNQGDQVKKNKNINTFRNSFMTNNNPYYNEVSDYIKNNYPSTNLQNRNGNVENPNINHYLNNKFSKNINSNFGTEMKSPILKNSNSNNNGLISNIPSTISKYSSLIDAKNVNNRPSSAIMVKGRHIREGSTSSYKNDNSNNNSNNNPFAQLTRSPSSQNVPQLIKRNSSNTPMNKPSVPLKRETPRNNYLLNLDPTKGGNTPLGNRTMRPSSTVERVKINYASNLNPLSSVNNIKNRYEEFEAMNRRGYSLSSRANDLKSQSLKYSDQKYNTPSNKFSASGIYRSNGNSTSKQK
jgi:hypothetical protein